MTEVHYITYGEAVFLHIRLMSLLGEQRYGVFDRSLVQSALARPQHAATYEGADIVRQAATLCFGLIKNHPWVGGNKRTATAIVDEFLFRNGFAVSSTTEAVVELVTAVEDGRFAVDEIDIWFRNHTEIFPKHDL